MSSLRPSPVAPDAFRAALSKFATGVTVITAAGSEGPVGITVNSFASVSLDPPLVLWSLGKTSNRLEVFEEAQHYCVHILARDQQELCWAFTRDATAAGKTQLGTTPHGVPIFDGCLARFECSAHAVHDGGDHRIFVAHVDAVTISDTAPLIFFDRAFGGFEKATAPSG